MIGFPVKTPRVLRRLFPNYVWDFSSKEKTIYLTFDDGPTAEITTWILDTLKPYNAKATFFCIGDNIEKHPEVFNTILSAGHSIGNHTTNHPNGWKTKHDIYLENTESTEKTIAKTVTNSKDNLVKLFRPPYGKIKPKQAKALIALGYKIIMWSVLSYDWKKKVTKVDCLSKVIKHTKSGDIVVFHDSIKASKNMKYALPKVLEHFSKQGYVFKAI